jgi:uroporphyrinogen decarboxylase
MTNSLKNGPENCCRTPAAAERPTLLVDADPQGNATTGVGVQKSAVKIHTYHLILGTALAAEVTLQPIHAFAVDAAILFADILLPLEAMGLHLDFVEGEGPVLRNPVRSRKDAEALRIAEPEESLGYVLESLRLVRRELDGKVPLIGFAGAPFTLAGYAIEGGGSRNFTLTKRLMYEHPETWELLMGRITEALTVFLLKQASAGAPDSPIV